LWFFDRAKTDDKILFIDARNVFTQIDRAHREFSEEQVQNIALISQLHKGRRDKFVRVVDRYFASGMERLVENEKKVKPVSAQLLEVLEDQEGKTAVGELVKQWAGLNKLQTRYAQYCEKHAGEEAVDAKNKAQHQLREAFDPFFAALHAGLKQLDKTVRQHEKQQAEQAQKDGKRGTTDRQTRALKTALEKLHREVKQAEIFFQHIRWLEERFPKAEYEDVTGLCKLASPADLEEQDYSLNPGRYVGVVIEEDGKTEEEFAADLDGMAKEFASLAAATRELEATIEKNIATIIGQ
jgi:type I restriction enzyme M protein